VQLLPSTVDPPRPEVMVNALPRWELVGQQTPGTAAAHGWEQVAQTIERAASNFRDGEFLSAEIIERNVTPELAYAVWLERAKAKVSGEEDIFVPIALRVTMIFRPEEGTWKVVHRHADPITTTQPAESVIQQ
jgi:ketosteroid isomerase-like protein